MNNLIDQYLPKFKKIKCREYAIKYLESGEYFDLSKKDGLEYLIKEIDGQIPDFSNKKDLVEDWCKNFLDQCLEQKQKIIHKADLSLTIYKSNYIRNMQQEWQIRQIIPNLHNIIRDIVKEQIKNQSKEEK